MRIRSILYLCYVLAIAGGAFCARPGGIHAQQFLPPDPSSPIAPAEHSQCNAYSQAWSKLDTEITRLHQDCLDANQKNKAQRNSETGRGVGSRCTYGSCQSLHTRMFEVQSKRDPAVDACYANVEKHKQNQRLQREAEEQRRREAEEREERARAEQKEKEAAKREREQAEKEKRSDESERARKREDTNQKLIQLAAEQQRLEREALARRTEERQRQMEELKKRKEGVEDQYQQNVEKQTRNSQDDLLAQMRNKGGTENTIFRTSDVHKNAGQEFDLSPVDSGKSGEDSAGSLPQLPSQYEDSIAPEKDSYFSTVFRNVRDFASPMLEKGRAIYVEELREITEQNVNEVRDTIVAGVFDDAEGVRTAESMVKKYFDNSYKDPTRDLLDSAFDATAGGLLNEAAADISKSVTTSLGGTSPHAGLVGALADVAIKNGAEKLSDYARDTFVDSMSGKASEAYRNISERLFGPTDPVTQPVRDIAILRLPALVSKMRTPVAAAKAVYDYGTHMVNAMGEMFDRLIKSEFFGTAPPDNDPDK